MIRPLLASLALAMASLSHASDREAARTLVEQKNYPAALVIFERLVAQHPDDADLLTETARVYAWADQHPAAIRHYQALIQRFPERRPATALPLAWQLVWNGQPDLALPYFDEAATQAAQRREALHGRAESLVALNRLREAEATYLELAQAPDDLKAHKAAARVALWREDIGTAINRYTILAQQYPNDREVRLGLARALNEQGAHQAAARQYAEAIANDAPLARDTRVERARTLRWSGQDFAALEALGDAEGADDLRRALRRDTASHVRAEIEFSRDTDQLDIQALTLGWQPHRGAAFLDASLRLARIEQNTTHIDGTQAWLRGSTVLNTVRGVLQPSLSLGGRDYDGWQTAAWKAALKWLPADFWRIDFEAGNDVVETPLALQQQVEFDYAAAGADWRFAPRWMATLGGAVLRFDDGNQRQRGVGKLAYTWFVDQPRLVTGVEYMQFSDSDPAIARGYYNPETYREAKIFAHLEHRVQGWLLGARLALGRLSETPGSRSDLVNWELTAERELIPDLWFRVHASGSDSRSLAGGGSGYGRDVLGMSLHWLY